MRGFTGLKKVLVNNGIEFIGLNDYGHCGLFNINLYLIFGSNFN